MALLRCPVITGLILLFAALLGSSIYLYVTRPTHHWYPATILNVSNCHCQDYAATSLCQPQGELTYAYTVHGQVYKVTWSINDQRTPICSQVDCCQGDALNHRSYWFLAPPNAPQSIEQVYDSNTPTSTLEALTLDNWSVVAYFIFSLGLAGMIMTIVSIVIFGKDPQVLTINQSAPLLSSRLLL